MRARAQVGLDYGVCDDGLAFGAQRIHLALGRHAGRGLDGAHAPGREPGGILLLGCCGHDVSYSRFFASSTGCSQLWRSAPEAISAMIRSSLAACSRAFCTSASAWLAGKDTMPSSSPTMTSPGWMTCPPMLTGALTSPGPSL